MLWSRSVLLTLLACVGGALVTVAAAGAAGESPQPYTLEEIIALALERHPAIAAARGAVRQGRGQQATARAYPNPAISGSAGRGAIRDPSTGVAITERTVTIEQPLEWPEKRRARRQAADAGLAEASAALDEARLALLADVKVAFYELLYAQADAALTAQNLTTVEDVLRTVQARAAAGDATSFETMKAAVEVQKARKDLTRTQNLLTVARARLNTLTVGTLGAQFSVQGEFDSLREELDLEKLRAGMLAGHPTLRRFSRQAEQAAYRVQLERESRIPNLIISGTYHREAGDESFVAGLTVPIPIWYQRQGEIESALGAKYRAEAERLRVQTELDQAMVEQAQEVRTATAQIQVFETGLLKQAERTLTVARTSFRQGAVGLLDVLDAQRVYRETLLEYAQARRDLSVALARLERIVGGRV